MYALGVDFGLKVIGLAITDYNKQIATPLKQFEYSNNDINFCVKQIIDVYEEFNKKIDTIIIGYPIYKSGDKSNMCIIIDNFKDILSSNIPNVKIILFDERNTTLEAISSMKNVGLKFSTIRRKKDKLSAQIILDNWLKNGRLE